MTNHSAHLDRMFHALADPTRRAIVARLTQGPASVTALSGPFEIAMPTLLAHIRVLERSGLIGTAKQGRVRTCEVRPAALNETETWLARQRAVWEGRLDRLEAYVATMQANGQVKEKTRGPRRRKA